MTRCAFSSGFTLVELLVALAILGVIATFIIPKVLQAQQDGKYNAMAKEVAGMISGAYDAYKVDHGNAATADTLPADLRPYLNYVRVESVADFDRYYGSGTFSCSNYDCLVLHNGALLAYSRSEPFCDTTANNAIYFYMDPDGVANGNPGKSVLFFLYFNGRLATYETITPGTKAGDPGVCGPTYNPMPNSDPPWFSWDR